MPYASESLRHRRNLHLSGTAVYAQQATEAQLAELRRQLDALREELNRYQGEQESIQQRLQQEELELARLHREIFNTERSIAISHNVSEALAEEAEQLERLSHQQETQVRREIQAVYRNGPQEPIKLLLNQEDPAQFSLMLGYYRRLLAVREEKILQYRDTMRDLQQNRLARQEEEARLGELLTRLDEQRDTLQVSRVRRQETLAMLSAEIANTEQQIAQKEADQRRLEELISSIARQAEELSVPSNITPFAEIRGQCRWPTQGQIVGQFGQARTGTLRWNGVQIAAPDGAEVQAVHQGRVLFADYLRGYGLLVIIDHDDAYLTLYGHNQYLYVEPGDWVQSGQPIARVGNTGGQQDAGLYFEIRQQGRPTNPANWCG